VRALAAVIILLCFLDTRAGSTIVGAGSQTCSAWTNRKKNAVARGSFENWLVGFISAFVISTSPSARARPAGDGFRKQVGSGRLGDSKGDRGSNSVQALREERDRNIQVVAPGCQSPCQNRVRWLRPIENADAFLLGVNIDVEDLNGPFQATYQILNYRGLP